MYDIASIYSARSVDDAIRALQADPAAVVIAGGTDVLIKIREGKLAGGSLVSIHELGEELSGVTLADNGDVEIGPLTTFRGVTFSDVIRRTIPVLGEAADMAGGPQLRAAGTIGGNVCHGLHPGGPGRGAAGARPQGRAGGAHLPVVPGGGQGGPGPL